MQKISIIIPTVNSPWLDQILTRLGQQTRGLDWVEVLVIGLDEKGIYQKYNRVKFIDTIQKMRPATVRNIGIQEAKGDIICFLDDDCLPDPTWLANLLAPYKRGIKVVGGGVTFPTDSYWTICDSLAHFHNVLAEVGSGWREYLPSLNFSAHRTVFEQVGLFDENFPFPAGEDTELTQRIRQAGYGLWFEADAVVFHAARRESGRQVWRRAWTFGKSLSFNPRNLDLLHPSPFFRYWLIIYLTALPRAVIATWKIFQQYPSLLKYRSSILGILVSKFAWQLGVATACRYTRQEKSAYR